MALILKNIFRTTTASKLVTNNVQIFFTTRSITSRITAGHVQIISSEAIKPSSPTPKHLRTYKLSLLDQLSSHMYVPLVFFYSANCKQLPTQDFRKKSDFLKQSLAKTLTRYYPFAGRFIDGFSVDCNDHGAKFIEAHVNNDISKFLHPPKMELLQHLIPPSPQLSNLEISQMETLAVQVNLFSSGDMAIGIYFSHGVADGTAISNFMKTWAEVTREEVSANANNNNNDDNISNNNVVSDLTSLFPPVNFQFTNPPPPSSRNIVFKRYMFDGKKIAALKEKVNKELMANNNSDDDVLQATRFGVVSALIWGASIAIARKKVTDKNQSHAMHYTMNLRNKLNNLPKSPQSMGNIYRLVRVERSLAQDEDDAMEITSLVQEVIKSKRNASSVIDSNEYLRLIKNMSEGLGDTRSFLLSSVAGLPVYETDFGWGKPVWFTVGPLSLPNAAVLSTTSDGEGLEALVVMRKEDMDKFEQHPPIMAYASSNPSIYIRK